MPEDIDRGKLPVMEVKCFLLFLRVRRWDPGGHPLRGGHGLLPHPPPRAGGVAGLRALHRHLLYHGELLFHLISVSQLRWNSKIVSTFAQYPVSSIPRLNSFSDSNWFPCLVAKVKVVIFLLFFFLHRQTVEGRGVGLAVT